MNILVDVYSAKKMSLSELVDGYAGRGIEWMLVKRLNSLSSLGLILVENESIELTGNLAFNIARVTLFFKKTFNLPAGG